jgi:diaminohydroxyphosphoribosylaminopyrimidine deaminase/5-amino-6-(5-phosphoribosylamino)uracil reductase
MKETNIQTVDFMKIAIEEQNKCFSYPKVGVVIVKDGRILSKAYRYEVEGKHAEF